MKYLMSINEMFDRVLETDYHIVKGSKYKILFKTSKHKYRLDLEPELELGIGIVNHISFSDADVSDNANQKEYDRLIGKGEMIEVINRITYIIKDLLKKKIIKNNFCIGGCRLKVKNAIYKHYLDTVVGKYNKYETDFYPCGWGYYFKLKI